LDPGFSEKGLIELSLRVTHRVFFWGVAKWHIFAQFFYLSQSLQDLSSNPLNLESNQAVGRGGEALYIVVGWKGDFMLQL